MNGKCPTPRAQETGKSPTLSRGGTLGDSLDTSITEITEWLFSVQLKWSFQTDMGMAFSSRDIYFHATRRNRSDVMTCWEALAWEFYNTPLSNTPAGRRFLGGFLIGGSSVGWVIKFLGWVQQNWAGQSEIVGMTGLSCRRNDMQWSWPSGSRGQSPWKLVEFRIFQQLRMA